ncbi:hypothetical protein DSO57_1020199 [Entomophthora muscae]|uniref:Uncharacterized protein n=1 Tax=Entomophthora muscae TaxID=34485 RepID=A0ACC2SGW5_9FUNG|nr:hypothetical protein DSO57_1020199 [Entomophthora muscae]
MDYMMKRDSLVRQEQTSRAFDGVNGGDRGDWLMFVIGQAIERYSVKPPLKHLVELGGTDLSHQVVWKDAFDNLMLGRDEAAPRRLARITWSMDSVHSARLLFDGYLYRCFPRNLYALHNCLHKSPIPDTNAEGSFSTRFQPDSGLFSQMISYHSLNKISHMSQSTLYNHLFNILNPATTAHQYLLRAKADIQTKSCFKLWKAPLGEACFRGSPVDSSQFFPSRGSKRHQIAIMQLQT